MDNITWGTGDVEDVKLVVQKTSNSIYDVFVCLDKTKSNLIYELDRNYADAVINSSLCLSDLQDNKKPLYRQAMIEMAMENFILFPHGSVKDYDKKKATDVLRRCKQDFLNMDDGWGMGDAEDVKLVVQKTSNSIYDVFVCLDKNKSNLVYELERKDVNDVMNSTSYISEPTDQKTRPKKDSFLSLLPSLIVTGCALSCLFVLGRLYLTPLPTPIQASTSRRSSPTHHSTPQIKKKSKLSKSNSKRFSIKNLKRKSRLKSKSKK
eukprot:GHVP01004395.1.p1 GENE.GHVP01004395.1~~GHVP01004395.1.p1  ORF type:complete len:292 (+),score=32.49 GHVP01004395.1:87-878(+)